MLTAAQTKAIIERDYLLPAHNNVISHYAAGEDCGYAVVTYATGNKELLWVAANPEDSPRVVEMAISGPEKTAAWLYEQVGLEELCPAE